MKLRLEKFNGIAPRMGPKLLPPYGAQEAVNARLESGELRAFNELDEVLAVLTPNARSVYMLGSDPAFTPLSWATDVDVARSPVSDSEQRVYFTGDGLPKKTNLALASSGGGPYPTTSYLLGTPAPTTAPTLAATGSGGTTETRIYVYTYVTQFGLVLEESPPSPPATITITNSQTVNVTAIASPAITTGRNYVYKRVYRSVGTGLLLVAQIAIGTTSFSDNIAAANLPGDLLATTDWTPPPDDLKGITALPGGVLAAFRENEVWFSEPGFPHAWPAKYMQSFDSKVVGIKAFGNSIAVGTEAHPYVGTGVHPDSFTFQKIPQLEPCLSKRSMASDQNGVIYASPNGFMGIGPNGNGLITTALLTRYEFANYNPASMLGVTFDNRYYGFYTVDGITQALVLKRGDDPPLVNMAVSAVAATVEPTTNRLLVIDAVNNKLYSVDPINTLPMTYKWRSRLIEAGYATNFGVLQVITSELDPATAAQQADLVATNAAIVAYNISIFTVAKTKSALGLATLNTIPLNGSLMRDQLPTIETKVGVSVYAGGKLRFTAKVASNAPVRLPSGFRALNWEVELTGQIPVQAVELASSMAELRE